MSSPLKVTSSKHNIISFPKFSTLPPEVRSIIWTFTALTPRVIEVNSYQTSIKKRRVQRLTSKTIVPALLHTCHESRLIGLLHYEKFIPIDIFSGTYINYNLDFIFLNWSADDLWKFWVGQRTQMPEKKCELARKCTRLLVGPYQRFTMVSDGDVLAEFGAVKEVAVIYDAAWMQYVSKPNLDPHKNKIPGVVGSPIEFTSLQDENEDGKIENYKITGSNEWVALQKRELESMYLVQAWRGSGQLITKEEKTARRVGKRG